ncbi:potassium channel family protein [Legionella sp. CNM-1927-20]|uniref:potassium channel family protein n=1 Tax=Legionella sp. CNM-1927-20 TaxID=3422221 RepID=UPI00403ABD53
MTKNTKKQTNYLRRKILFLWEKWFELPLIVLALIWLILIIIELTLGLNKPLETFSFTIWLIFIFDFIVRLLLSPSKLKYLERNWLALFVLFFPAFRLFRLFSFLRATRSLYLFKIFSSIRYSTRVLGFTLGRQGFFYIISLTILVILVGAAGIYAFEGVFANYGEALWWAAMMITTMGSDFWPKTVEGRILCLGLAIYGFAIFGYITAIVASFLIDKEARDKANQAKLLHAIEELKQEIRSLKDNA